VSYYNWETLLKTVFRTTARASYSGPLHFKMAAPHDSPAPNPAAPITSPFFTLPLRTASSRARGMLPALVLPYSSRLAMTYERKGKIVGRLIGAIRVADRGTLRVPWTSAA
jgi:hypothetical protein